MYSYSFIIVQPAHSKKLPLKQWKTHGDIWEHTPELSQGETDWIHSGESVLHHIILNLNPNNRADHISQPEAPEPIWVRWHPVPLFLTGGSGAQHNILVLTFCFSLSSSPASDLNPISQSLPETSESQGSCYNFSQKTKMLIIHYLISLKPWALREFFGINTSFIDSICGTQKIILACPSVCKNNKKYVYTKRLDNGSLWAKCTRGSKKK